MNINDLHPNELRRFAELGRLSATLIHEISSPLTAALLNLELSDSASPAIRKAYYNIQTLRRYVEAIRQQISSPAQVSSFRLASQIRQIKRFLLPLADEAGVIIDFGEAPKYIKLHGNPIKFQQILNNLIINAVQAYEGLSLVKRMPVVRVSFRLAKNSLIIKVADNGKGIPEAKLNQIFEAFYTSKKSKGKNSGLGLAIAKHHVTTAFSGSLSVTSQLGKGTQFSIKLPLSPKTHVLK